MSVKLPPLSIPNLHKSNTPFEPKTYSRKKLPPIEEEQIEEEQIREERIIICQNALWRELYPIYSDILRQNPTSSTKPNVPLSS